MIPALSIVIPHKKTPANDLAMRLNFQMLLENTINSFELIINDVVPGDPYVMWNEYAKVAKGRIVVFSNSDVLMAPNWDEFIVKHISENAILTGYLVEAGNIGVNPVNIYKSFGLTPDTFDRAAFEAWAQEYGSTVPEVQEQRAWYMPSAMYRDWFLWTGGFDVEKSFPAPNDIKYFDKCRDDFGTKFVRVRSMAYHFQYLSGRS